MEEGDDKLAKGSHPLLDSSLYTDQIRPLLDAVDVLRQLQVTKEGIHLPTIVVIGDQSAGKSSVMESLAGLSLPRGRGISTRVPLIMKIQHGTETELRLEYNGQKVVTDEANVAVAISTATNEIAGCGTAVSSNPITLIVKKHGVPDLTMVDLPGLTRVPVVGQPKDIYEQLSAMIIDYIKPHESIILNVVAATMEFQTCEAIRMSQKFDKRGERTLAVITKADIEPTGLLEQIANDVVRIGELGYFCVRNRVGDESFEEARKEEANLFSSHPLLSQIDKAIVGIPVLAERLVQIQAMIISRSLPGIVQKIDEKLSSCVSEMDDIPRVYSAVERLAAFTGIVREATGSLKQVMLAREHTEFPEEEKYMLHCAARLVEMLNEYKEQLDASPESNHLKDFLREEIDELQETKAIELANFLPGAAFRTILRKKVSRISDIPLSFVKNVWNYIESVVIAVLTRHSEDHPQLQLCLKRAGHVIVSRLKQKSLDWVQNYIKMEQLTDYTCSPEYMEKWRKLISLQTAFIDAVFISKPVNIAISEIGFVQNPGDFTDCNEDLLRKAYDLRMRMIAYWDIVLRRLVDSMALHIQLAVHELADSKGIEEEIFAEFDGPHKSSIDRIMAESPSLAAKRAKINSRIQLLTKSKEVLAEAMEKLAVN